MAEVAAIFLAFALVTAVGFLASRTFIITRCPDIPVLLAIGLLLGPLNRAAVDAGYGSTSAARVLDPGLLQDAAPYVSALALVVILFDSGLRLDVQEFGRSIRPALLHTLPTFVLTVLSVSGVAHFVFGMPPLVAAILGVALSNVGQTVSAAIVRDMRLDEQTRAIYFVEMAIYDLISIPILVSLLEFGQGSGDVADFSRQFAAVLSVSFFLGVSGGLIWMYVLGRMRDHPNAYMLTLAALLFVYALNDTLGGSGAVSVLLFGLVVGNRKTILRGMGFRRPEETDPRVQDFHNEVTFFVRTVFFLLLGINFSTGARGDFVVRSEYWPLSLFVNSGGVFLLGILLILGAIVGSRVLIVRTISARKHPERRALTLVFGRGLGTAVLATLPFIATGYTPGTEYYATFHPWESVFLNTALLIVLLTVLATSVLVWRSEMWPLRTGRPKRHAGPAVASRESLSTRSKPR